MIYTSQSAKVRTDPSAPPDWSRVGFTGRKLYGGRPRAFVSRSREAGSSVLVRTEGEAFYAVRFTVEHVLETGLPSGPVLGDASREVERVIPTVDKPMPEDLSSSGDF